MLTGISCQPMVPLSLDWDNPDPRLVWPLPPEPPRIQYIGAIQAGASAVGARAGRGLTSLIMGRNRAMMIKPVAVATNASGLTAVADPAIPTVHCFDFETQKAWQVKQDRRVPLQSPVGVAVGAQGAVYVSDSVQGCVFVFDGGKKLSHTLGEGVLSRPTGLALSPSGERLYVVDTVACRITYFNPDGTFLGAFGERGNQAGQFNFPTHIATTPDGTIWVADSLNFRVQSFRPDGTFVHSFGNAGDGAGDFARPKGIGVDSGGRVYVADAAFENVQIFSPEGVLLLAFGGPGTGPGQFSLPAGLFVDSHNTIWVADSFNQRIQVFRLLEGSVQ
ncbi:MAG: hypothetical protein GWP08_01235 [Nitrospiraceae bacterium]|nr:hypothetical protein [Nitrospiraceae bacterium]